MIQFLIHRPIAVFMTFLALTIMGVLAFYKVPVSLLPHVEVPEVTVYTNYDQYSAREFYDVITEPMIRQLRQCTGLEDIDAETTDGQAEIQMTFDYGVNTDLAAIEVNEILDRLIRDMPEDMERPRVVKASVTDVPVVYLNLYLKPELESEAAYVELSDLARNVIRKRLEHIREIAFVDITGLDKPEIAIIPDEHKIRSLNINPAAIHSAFSENNLDLGSVRVEQGQYQYNVRFESRLYTEEEIGNLYLNFEDKLIQIKDIATVSKRKATREGKFTSNGWSAISIAVIKQPDARMSELKQELAKGMNILSQEFPDIIFSVSQDQTTLLSYAISNLGWSLLLGLVLAVAVVFVFMSDLRLPVLIAIVIPISVIVTILFFKLMNLSLNIVSLSGLILGLGMMIDNAIIVVDNITQQWQKHQQLDRGCIKGTGEVIKPLLSSALTTICVFVPLIFVGGIAGGLFYDQAIAVTIGLMVSFWVSITLLPVGYFTLFKNKEVQQAVVAERQSLVMRGCDFLYEKGLQLVFKYQWPVLVGFLAIALLTFFVAGLIKKEQFPSFEKNETAVLIYWNDNLSVESIEGKVKKIMRGVKEDIKLFNAWIGVQDYYLNKTYDIKKNETKLYIKAHDPDARVRVEEALEQQLRAVSSKATYELLPADDIFQSAFKQHNQDFEVRLYPDRQQSDISYLSSLTQKIYVQNKQFLKGQTIEYPSILTHQNEYLSLVFEAEKLMLYGVSLTDLTNVLMSKLNNLKIGELNSSAKIIPVVLGVKDQDLSSLLDRTTVQNVRGVNIPVRRLVSMKLKKGFSEIKAGLEGEYVSVPIEMGAEQRASAETYFRDFFKATQMPVKYAFSGSMYQTETIIKSLITVFIISIVLLFFILMTQFESIVQPLIILLELPIALGGTLGLLYLSGESLNIMSGIGIIVMSGIIINDSILKIYTFNRLRRSGMDLMDVIHQGGKKRLRSVLMTSITTMLSLVPFLLGSGIGVELQRPLAVAVIGGLGLGTLVSLYFVPLIYYLIYRNRSVPLVKPV